MRIYDDSLRFPARKNPRMKHYDYSSPNYYFVTICTYEKRCIFGKPGLLNPYGQIAQEGIPAIGNHFPNVRVDKFFVMPNHVHMILVFERSGVELSTIVGQYKSYVTKMIHLIAPGGKVWQSSYHDHVIRNQSSYEKIWLYIDANPRNWGKDCFFQESATE